MAAPGNSDEPRFPAGRPQTMKQVNEALVLRLLKDHGPMSRAQIARATGLSRPTVSKAVKSLLEDSLVIESEYASAGSSGGKRGLLVEFNARAGHVVSVDLGSSLALAAVGNLRGELVAKVRKPIPKRLGVESFLGALEDLIFEVLQESGVPLSTLKGVMLGVPGVVDPSSKSVSASPSLEWSDLPLCEELASRLGVPVHMENDVNLAALGEQVQGAAKDRRNVVFVAVRDGIGAGVVIDGDLYRGSSAAAGEIGFMITSLTTLEVRRSSRSGRGCLEIEASGLALEERYSREIRARNQDAASAAGHVDGQSYLPAAQIFRAASRGDELAIRAVTDALDHLAAAISNTVAVLDPEVIILGGDIQEGGDFALERIRSLLKYSLPRTPEIVYSRLGEDSVLVGGIRFAVDVIDTSYELIRHSMR